MSLILFLIAKICTYGNVSFITGLATNTLNDEAYPRRI